MPIEPRARRAVRARLGLYVRLVLLLHVLFVAVYGGLNWLTARRDDLLRLHFDWETRFPFVPGMIYAYLSIAILFVLPLFVLDEDGLRLLARRIALVIVMSGAAFLLLPARLGFARPGHVPGYEGVYRLLYALDGPHNLVPSLHIAQSALIAAALGRRAPGWARALLLAWLALLAAAVVLVHQHHLADLAGGFAAAALTAAIVRGPASPSSGSG